MWWLKPWILVTNENYQTILAQLRLCISEQERTVTYKQVIFVNILVMQKKKKSDIICLTKKYQLGLEPFLPSQTIDLHIHHSVPEHLAATLSLAACA